LKLLVNELLGSSWEWLSAMLQAPKGNNERLSFIYDKRRVQPSGLAGEIVLPPLPTVIRPAVRSNAVHRWLQAGQEKFSLLTRIYAMVKTQPTDWRNYSPGAVYCNRNPQTRRSGTDEGT